MDFIKSKIVSPLFIENSCLRPNPCPAIDLCARTQWGCVGNQRRATPNASCVQHSSADKDQQWTDNNAPFNYGAKWRWDCAKSLRRERVVLKGDRMGWQRHRWVVDTGFSAQINKLNTKQSGNKFCRLAGETVLQLCVFAQQATPQVCTYWINT